MPGGGVGIFNACTDQYGAPPNGWGQRYGGISQRHECDAFPEKLKPGCYWRFDWCVSLFPPLSLSLPPGTGQTMGRSCVFFPLSAN
jgi:hypothetical protein